VPNADEFPVLGGSSTPPQVNGYSTHTGPTAAQVLQAPPVRKDTSKSDNSATEGQEQFRPIVGQVRISFTSRLRSIINVVYFHRLYLHRRPSRPLLRTLRYRLSLQYLHFPTNSLYPSPLSPTAHLTPQRRCPSQHRSRRGAHTHPTCLLCTHRPVSAFLLTSPGPSAHSTS
jgi:hypothetical protein